MSDLSQVLPHTGSLIRRAQQRHAAEWSKLVSTTITSVQFAAMAILEHSPGSSQRELGDALEIDRSTIADLAARLVRNGLVQRQQDNTDRRRYILQLTPLGIAELERLRPLAYNVEHALTQRMTPLEINDLRRLLLLLLKN